MTSDEIDVLADAIVSRIDLPTKEEILEVIANALPDRSEVLKAIAQGIYDSMPYPSEIVNAITNGVVESHR
jgi:hypothetical protein